MLHRGVLSRERSLAQVSIMVTSLEMVGASSASFTEQGRGRLAGGFYAFER